MAKRSFLKPFATTAAALLAMPAMASLPSTQTLVVNAPPSSDAAVADLVIEHSGEQRMLFADHKSHRSHSSHSSHRSHYSSSR